MMADRSQARREGMGDFGWPGGVLNWSEPRDPSRTKGLNRHNRCGRGPGHGAGPGGWVRPGPVKQQVVSTNVQADRRGAPPPEDARADVTTAESQTGQAKRASANGCTDRENGERAQGPRDARAGREPGSTPDGPRAHGQDLSGPRRKCERGTSRRVRTVWCGGAPGRLE